jgi:hypothetical protein
MTFVLLARSAWSKIFKLASRGVRGLRLTKTRVVEPTFQNRNAVRRL